MCGKGGAEEEEAARAGYRTKKRTPHKDVGNNLLEFNMLQCVLLFVV